MNFEEYDQILNKHFSDAGLSDFTPIEKAMIHKVKQGKNIVIRHAEIPELKTGLQLVSLLKAPQAFEGSPRVLWFTSTTDKTRKRVDQLREWIRRSEIVVEPADDKGKIIEQRNNIFDGTDIIIGTPKRMLELYNQNGYHINQLSLVIIEDLSEICKSPTLLQCVRRINESLPKVQKMVVTHGDHSKQTLFIDEIISYYDTITSFE